MRPIVTDVAWSVCLFDVTVSCAETAKPIDMPFWVRTWVSQRIMCLKHGSARRRDRSQSEWPRWMEKVRPWCGQPSDRGRLRLKNRIKRRRHIILWQSSHWKLTFYWPIFYFHSFSSRPLSKFNIVSSKSTSFTACRSCCEPQWGFES